MRAPRSLYCSRQRTESDITHRARDAEMLALEMDVEAKATGQRIGVDERRLVDGLLDAVVGLQDTLRRYSGPHRCLL